MNPMLLSQPVVDRPHQPQHLGAVYYLPKTILTLTIKSYGRIKQVEVDGKEDPRPIPEVVVIEGVEPREIADSRYPYVLQYDPSITSNDRVCIGVSQAGLLQSVEGAADDKTGDIAIAIAKLAGRLAGPGAFAGTVAKTESDKLFTELRTMKIDIDPLDERQWQVVNMAMRANLGPIAANYEFGVGDIKNLVGAASPKSCPLNSVCYRTRVPVQLFLARKRGRDYQVTSSVFAKVVSQKVTANIDVSRAFMVEKVTKLKFTNGILTAVNMRKPSEALAVAKLPLTVLDAAMTSALAAPGNFLAKANGSAVTTKLAQDAADTETNIVKLQEQLKAIREGDYSNTPETGTLMADAFKLTCTTPSVGAGKQGANDGI